MESWRQDNTEGYSQTEIDDLNREWESIVESEKLEPFTDEYYDREKQFADDVAKR